tara:strand:- start:418 stop:2622 length:2205 start_codon:yes stop_codon:yes gene_type:complete
MTKKNKPQKTRRYLFALALVALGYDIFPLRVGSKLPLNAGWQEEAAPDAGPWANGEDYNIGIATGRQFVAIDIDVKDGKPGEKTWAALCKKLGIVESKVQQETPTSGRHVLYAADAAHPIGNSVEKLGPGVDVRGVGGYIVGAGSVVDGKEYTMTGGKLGLPAMPDVLASLCGRARERDAERDIPMADLDTELNIARARKMLVGAETSVQGAGGDDQAFRTAARVRDEGISEAICVEIMMEDDGWNERCSPPWSLVELETKVRNAYNHAKKRIGVDTPEAQFADEPDSDEPEVRPLTPMEEFNSRYALLHTSPSHVIMEEYKDKHGKHLYRTFLPASFHQFNIDKFYFDEDGKKRFYSKEWLMWPGQRKFLGFTFQPKVHGHVDGMYNIWRGFDYAPVHGMTKKEAIAGCDLFLRHVRDVVCQGRQQDYNWIMNHFAHLIQYPEKKPETAIVIVGKKGTGKSMIFSVMGALMKQHYFVSAQLRHLLDKFNVHMAPLLIFQFEEAFWAGNKQAEGVLKHLITGKTLAVEPKGIDPYTIDSYMRNYMTSNESWAVPASVDERRFAVFECSSARKDDDAYFLKIFKQLDAGGYEALMTYLSLRVVDKALVHRAPKTAALAGQKIASLDIDGRWLHGCLTEGTIPGLGGDVADGDNWAARHLCTDVYEQYLMFGKTQGHRYPLSADAFGTKIKDMLGASVTRKRVQKGVSRNYYYEFQGLTKGRGAFEKWLGNEINWE